jgi:adenine deaminase
MAIAANKVITMGGGSAVVKDGQVVGAMPLPIAGLMSELSAEETAKQNEEFRKSVYTLGCPKDFEPLMTTAFISLSVIPHIKITTQGLIDVNNQKKLDLFC